MGFFDMLGFSYGGSFGNSRTKQLYTVPLPIKTSPTVDTLSTVKDFQNIGTQTLSQNIGFSISPKLGHFTVSPSLSLSGSRTWTQSKTSTVEFEPNGNELVLEYNSTINLQAC